MVKKFFLLTLLPLSPFFLFAAEKISFESQDGVQLVGDFYKPSSPQNFTLILLHGLGSVKEEWNSFAQFLSSKGYGVFLYDARGHGKSTTKKSGGQVNFQLFFGRGLSSEWGKMIEDLEVAIRYLKEKYKLSANKIAVGGASLGANVALRVAARNPQIPFAILLSPGIDYQGITTHDVIPKMGNRPLLLCVSPADRYAYQSVKELERIAGSNPPSPSPPFSRGENKKGVAVIIETQNQGHGVQMFRRARADAPSPLEVKIFQWLEKIK